jgi:hypothetical protein
VRLGGNAQIVSRGPPGEEQIVMEMVWFLALGRNTVDVEADNGRFLLWLEDGARFFEDLPAGSIGQSGVLGFDVAAGKEPAVEATVVDEENAAGIGRDDETGAGDVAGCELTAGKRIAGAREKHKDEVAAFAGLAIGGVEEGADEGSSGGKVDHK